MKEHVAIHRFYTSFLLRTIRLISMVLLACLVVVSLVEGTVPRYPLFFLSLIIMWEVFFHFSLIRRRPELTIADNEGKDMVLSFSHEALDAIYRGDATESILPTLMRRPQVSFMLKRLLLEPKDVPLLPVPKDALRSKSFEVAQTRQGIYVTTMDMFAAYLLLIEPETKLLFSRELKTEDLFSIVDWANLNFSYEETIDTPYFTMTGDGIGEGLISGWTPETKHYTKDYTAEALSKNTRMLGRDKEYQELLNALSSSEQRNVLLVGDTGVGKEKLVAAIARDSFSGKLPGPLNHKRIITLMVGPLLAGAENRSELETRLQTIIAELSHAGNVILSIPEMQEIMGESSFNLNLSGALLPYLQDGSIPIIGTMTKGNYKTYMEKNSLNDVFSLLTLEEPSKEIAQVMVYQKANEIEKQSHVLIPYVTVKQVLNLSENYLPDNVLPGNAIHLLTDAIHHADKEHMFGSKRVVTPENVIQVVEGKVHASVAAPTKDEKTLLLHLEEKLHQRVIGQTHAIQVISEALRRSRSGVSKHDRPISFLFLGPTGVGKTETAKALAALYFGGEERILRLDMSEYSDASSIRRLLGASAGEGSERGELTDKIHDNPYTLVLLDEFEKANPKILDLFLQVFADGRLTDNKGKTVSFSHAIIIATSNAASEFIREEVAKGTSIDKTFQTKLLENVQANHLFKPELLNRFDGIVVYTPLTENDLRSVTTLLLQSVTKQLQEQDIEVSFEKNVLDKISKEGADEQFGARPLGRYIQDTIEDTLANLKLEEKLKRGDTITFTVGDDGAIKTIITSR